MYFDSYGELNIPTPCVGVCLKSRENGCDCILCFECVRKCPQDALR